ASGRGGRREHGLPRALHPRLVLRRDPPARGQHALALQHRRRLRAGAVHVRERRDRPPRHVVERARDADARLRPRRRRSQRRAGRRVTAATPPLVLELRPAESRHYASWGERLETVARHSRPDELHALCEEAYALGARAVLAVVDAPIREALLAFQRWRDVPVWAVVPNMFAFIRDLTDLGMVGAARARFTRLSPAAMVRTGLGAVGRLGPI